MSTTSLSHSHEQASHAGAQAMPLPSPPASPNLRKGKGVQAAAAPSPSTASYVRTPAGSPPASSARSEKSATASTSTLPHYQASQDDYAHVRGQAPAAPGGGLAPSPKQFAKETTSHSTPLQSTRRALPTQSPVQKKTSLLSRLKGSVQGLMADRSKLFMGCMLGATFMLLLALATSNPTLILFGVMMMTMGICGLVSQDNAAKPIAAPNPQQGAPDGKAADAAADKKEALADQLRQREAQAEHEAEAAGAKREAKASPAPVHTASAGHRLAQSGENSAPGPAAPASSDRKADATGSALASSPQLVDEPIAEHEARRLQLPIQPSLAQAAPTAAVSAATEEPAKA